MKKLLIIVVLLTSIAGSWMIGCSAGGSIGQWMAERDVARKELIATTQEVSDLQRMAEALPDGEDKYVLLHKIAQAEDVARTLNSRLEQLDTMISAAHTGDAATVGRSIGGLLEGVPKVGKYASFIGTLAGLVWGVIERWRRRRDVEQANGHLKKVVYSLEKAGPDWSDDDKAQIAALQGHETTTLVTRIKRDMGLD